MPEWINRRRFCQSAAATAAAAALPRFARGATGGSKRPNILLIVADDLGTDLGCYGLPQVRTPNIDRLASQGMCFNRGFVTQASCSPSRASIFTGLYPHQNGQLGLSHRGYRMREGTATVPAVLKASGYQTVVMGKIHVAPESLLPFDQRILHTRETQQVRDVAREARQVFQEKDDRPLFMMVNYFDPHVPFVRQAQGLPERPLDPEDAGILPFMLADTPATREWCAGYLQGVERLDAGVGLLLDELQASGLADNTMVVLIGDHGAPTARGKTTCYEAGLRIPYMVRWPGKVQPNTRSDAFVSTVDLSATFADAAGVEWPTPIEGLSLLPCFTGKPWPRSLLFGEFNSHTHQHWYPRRSVRDDRYKLIHNALYAEPNPVPNVDSCVAWEEVQRPRFDGTVARRAYEIAAHPPEFELYDLAVDPYETRNLAEVSACAETRARLSEHLLAWQRRTSDFLLKSTADPQHPGRN